VSGLNTFMFPLVANALGAVINAALLGFPGPVNGAGPTSSLIVIILFFYDIYAKKAFHPRDRRVRSGRC
ncbi:hypothetical protein, partial [Klebsiella variicola]|uniref:hypothetical protein n=1 Tax=Klebsiella variicola TaxID=244366 RepID=UPI002FF1AB33